MVYLRRNLKDKKILVVCNDAGGAEIVSAFVKKNIEPKNYHCVASGSAMKIFKKKKLKNLIKDFSNTKKVLKETGTDLLLAGTSWATALEINFIRAAKFIGIKTVAYLDHWVNYKERFGFPRRNWKQNLPDEIWVGDKYALKTARRAFKSFKVRFVPNHFFEEIKGNCKKYEGKARGGILIASEPVSAPVNFYGDKVGEYFNEHQILNLILDFLQKKKYDKKIIFRLHPSEEKNKYKEIISKFKKLKINISHDKNFFCDLAQVDTVIGMKSMFLVVSLICGKKVYSFLPGKEKCPLPFKQIKRIKKLDELKF